MFCVSLQFFITHSLQNHNDDVCVCVCFFYLLLRFEIWILFCIILHNDAYLSLVDDGGVIRGETMAAATVIVVCGNDCKHTTDYPTSQPVSQSLSLTRNVGEVG